MQVVVHMKKGELQHDSPLRHNAAFQQMNDKI